ncbi:MAG: hypothetical protein K2X47_04545 [Bdellovibrionales bacterium]|nr:hypothetical protein [Bdellovibrionales bacterium]
MLIHWITAASTVALLAVVACSPAKFEAVPPEGKTTVVPPTTGTVIQPFYTDRFVSEGPASVDVLVVVDNSGSMNYEQQSMSDRVGDLIGALNNGAGGRLSWRIAITTTDLSDLAGSNRFSGGRLLEFKNQAPGTLFVDRNSPGVVDSFGQTLQITNSPSTADKGDERGIGAAFRAIRMNEGGWIRPNAALAIVILSDEDERSGGGAFSGYPLERRTLSGTITSGNSSLGSSSSLYNNFCESTVDVMQLDFSDCPRDLVNFTAQKYGSGKALSSHPIIIRPGDTACYEQQRVQAGSETGRYGRVYAMLRDITGGQLGDACASNYGAQLTQIGTSVTQAQQVFNLRCQPATVNGVPDVDVVFSGTTTAPSTPLIKDSQLTFNPALPDGTVFTASYKCK